MRKFFIIFVTIMIMAVCCQPDENPFVLDEETELQENNN